MIAAFRAQSGLASKGAAVGAAEAFSQLALRDSGDYISRLDSWQVDP
jgi:hypothetical protein